MNLADFSEETRLRFTADQFVEPSVPIDAARLIVAWGSRTDMLHCPTETAL